MLRLTRIVAALTFIAATLVAASVQAAPNQAGATQSYLVLYKGNAVVADAIARAGGALVASYNQIGVAVARSSSASFAADVARDSRVEGAAPTAHFASRLGDGANSDADASAGNVPVSDSDNLSGRQWDMRQIHVPEAHAITGGSPAVLVGDLDSGVDYTHPDLAPNIDFANSASCIGGVVDQTPASWRDDNGHGTHTAGIIAAATNGVGIVGVAPNVRLAAVKVGDVNGFIFPEAAICGFMWAATHGFDVTNNSYFVDPWLFNCKNDAEQRAIWKALQRAIRYAMQQGVTVVATTGNQNLDLSDQNIDVISPDTDPNPPPREVTNACVVLPVEISGVIGVSGNGLLLQKASYSSYGVSATDLVAPGGDVAFQSTAAIPDGRVFSTWPMNITNVSRITRDCSVSPCAVYRTLQGTSMAAPHVAGVAALIISQHGKMSPGAVQAILSQTADPMACPPNPFNPGGTGAFLAECQGGVGHNSFYGSGQLNAFSAISK